MVSEKKLRPFQPVLVRNDEKNVWVCDFYSHYQGDPCLGYNHICTGGKDWKYCIPYEGNEHLVGTNQAPDEPEKFEFGEHVEVKVNDVDAWVKAIYLWPSEKAKGFHVCATEKEYNSWLQCRKADW